ncbi:MAG: TRAP transporter large permease [Thermoleophilia bacterium]
MSPGLMGLVSVIVLLAVMALDVPIGVAMAAVGFAGYALLVSPEAAYQVLAKDVYFTLDSYTMGMLVMFVLMGYLAFHSGIGAQLYEFAHKTLGFLPGGVAMANQVAGALFGAVCGSASATCATIGSIALPEMRKFKYADSLSTASVAAGGTLAILIPPSVIFVLYGLATEQSIGALFMAGIFPGVLLMLLYMVAVYVTVKRSPELAPPKPEERPRFAEVLRAAGGGLIETMLVFFLTLGGLFAGWFTPTEAGAVGAAGLLCVGLFRRKLGWAEIGRALRDTTKTSALILFLIAGATVYGRLIAVSRLPYELAELMTSMAVPAFVVMGLIMFVHLVLGMFIDAMAMILLTIPIFYPVAVDALGYDPIWFGVVIVYVVALGVITPPVGMNVYVVAGVSDGVSLQTIFRGIWPFVIAIIVAIVLLMVFPQIATFLPNALN